MTRCDYDTIFQRVSCVTLVAVAVTFTIILTNVFVDIDGLLSRKVKAKTFDVPEAVLDSEHSVKMKPSPNMIRTEFYKEDKNYEEDTEDIYRSKRSLESPSFLNHVKNPKFKSILTDRLATLLEELDEEETAPSVGKKEEATVNENNKQEGQKITTKAYNQELKKKLDKIMDAMSSNDIQKKDVITKHESKTEDDLLHLAMHNILLQGIIGHMDLNDVFKKVHTLVKSFKENDDGDGAKEAQKKQERFDMQKEIQEHVVKAVQHGPSVEESKFFEELTKCDTLQSEINTKRDEARGMTNPTQIGPKLLIKTIIDITSNKDKTQKELINSKENVKGVIKLIYNGKSVNFNRVEDDAQNTVKKNKEKYFADPDITLNDVTDKPVLLDFDPLELLLKADYIPNKKSYSNQIVESYLRKIPKNLGELLEQDSDKNLDKFDGKRLKRQIKIRNETNKTTPSAKPSDDDDELYVEIETHFDSKGMKGMKKKKLIRNIIDKIQKAIHSDLDILKDEKKKKHKHLQVKKRIQNPLDKNKSLLFNKIMIPLDTVYARNSDPISKTAPLEKFATKSGETWKKSYFGPAFLTGSKSMNSAEMGEVDVDYNKVLAVNGIPQRLQKPLNTDASDEMLSAKTYFDLGNLKFFIKNIDGTGLSIGFNQYTDEPPDPDTIKLFTGIENLIQAFSKSNGDDAPETPRLKDKISSEEKPHELSKRDINSEKQNNDHNLKSGEEDYHYNEYKIIFEHNVLPYDSYQEIYEDNKKRVALSMNKEANGNNYANNIEHIRAKIGTKVLPTLMDESIFYKKLKPSEILSLATLLDRKKRSITVKKIRNISKKSKHKKLSRFFNTYAHGRKKIILNKKRNKRQIDKIRIIATDSINKQRRSEENIFLIDDDNVLADRAIIREVETPDLVDNVEEKNSEEHYDVYETPHYTTNVFGGRSRHNPLMSKYPHIFLEEVGRSREEYMEPLVLNKLEVKPKFFVGSGDTKNETGQVPLENGTEQDGTLPKLNELVNALEPQQNYKLTLKIFPKNVSNINSGFKEIHTSINKSFNKNGLLYSSLLNVSEISKITKLNNTEKRPATLASTDSNFVVHIQEQQNKMDQLLRQHKKRIDEQLAHLKKERLNLDTMASMATENVKTLDNIKFAEMTENPKPDLLHMNKDDVTKLLATALFNLQAKNRASTTQTTTVTTVTTEASTTEQTTTMTEATTTIEPMKLKLLNKIQQNENITNEILHQINRNTEILQLFLTKLSGKIMKNRESVPEMQEKRIQDVSVETRRKFDDNIPPNFWKPFPPLPDTDNPFQQQSEHQKNETHYSIPFVYAYQQPFPLANYKHDVPVASVVYHGHIHTKPFAKHLKSKESKPTRRPMDIHDQEGGNQTKYFIDDIENDFKMAATKAKIGSLVPRNMTSSG